MKPYKKNWKENPPGFFNWFDLRKSAISKGICGRCFQNPVIRFKPYCVECKDLKPHEIYLLKKRIIDPTNICKICFKYPRLPNKSICQYCFERQLRKTEDESLPENVLFIEKNLIESESNEQ